MTKLNWNRGRARSLARANRHSKPEFRQQAMADYVNAHQLACFKCRQNTGPWAKTGLTKTASGNHRWAICTTCIKSGP